MAGEQNLWNTLKRHAMKDASWAHFNRHEDSAGVGIADVSFVIKPGLGRSVRGWIELKHIREWPKRPTTTLKLKHFKQEQRNWLRKQGSLGGHTWLLLQVDRDYLLFHWKVFDLLGQANQASLKHAVTMWCTNRLDYPQLISILLEKE